LSKTITALATPPGIGGLAIVRLSGDEAISIADKCFSGSARLVDAKPNTIHFGKFIFNNKIIDTVTASVFHSPKSYTGENTVEFGCHGGMLVSGEIINALLQSGAVLATAGEFTKRAFLNGKMDLTQVEAVESIIHSVSVPGAMTSARQLAGEFSQRVALLRKKLLDAAGLLELELDFADEDIELIPKQKILESINETQQFCTQLCESFRSAEILRSGYFVAIAGYPNSGKSTLFNTLLDRRRAIVSEIPGTTRDFLEETLLINGIAVKIIDTAGLRDTTDLIEIEGIKFGESVLEQSNLILVLNDVSLSPSNSNKLVAELNKKFPGRTIILLQNKIDKIGSATDFSNNSGFTEIQISAKHKSGIDELKEIIYNLALQSTERVSDVLINQRHFALLSKAAEELSSARTALESGMENEVIAIDVRSAIRTLGEIIGETFNEDILNNIFSNFCIGK